MPPLLSGLGAIPFGKASLILSLDSLVGNLHIGSFGSALFRMTGDLDVCQRGAVNVPETLYPEALHNRQIGISWESVGLLGGVVHTIEAS
jgi:hypothetical protein